MSKCAICKERQGTIKWVGEGGSIAMIHGLYEMWCELCCVRVQLKHAEERAMEIHKLRRRIKELEGESSVAT